MTEDRAQRTEVGRQRSECASDWSSAGRTDRRSVRGVGRISDPSYIEMAGWVVRVRRGEMQ
jgi:hypothetical protein